MLKKYSISISCIISCLFILFISACGDRILPDYFNFTVQNTDSEPIMGLRLTIYQNEESYGVDVTDTDGKAELPLRDSSTNFAYYVEVEDLDGDVNGSYQTKTVDLEITNLDYTITMECSTNTG